MPYWGSQPCPLQLCLLFCGAQHPVTLQMVRVASEQGWRGPALCPSFTRGWQPVTQGLWVVSTPLCSPPVETEIQEIQVLAVAH